MDIESQARAIKDAHSSTKKARESENYYKGLAGIYQQAYDDTTVIFKSLGILLGIWVEMMSDLIEYKKRNGNNEKAKKTQERLMLMDEHLSVFSKIQSDNYVLKCHNRQLETTNHLQREEIKDLKRQLELHTINL